MGAWGSSPFENDDAGDWLIELDGANTWEPVNSALEAVLTLEDGDASVESAAIAAAAVVAFAVSDNLEVDEEAAEALEFIKRAGRPSSELIELARTSLRAAAAESSELAELWEGDEEWLDSLALIEHTLVEAS